MPSKRSSATLIPAHARHNLKASTLSPADTRRLGVVWATSDAVQKLLGTPMPPPCGGLVFPYWTPGGKVDKRLTRVRLLPDPRDGVALGDGPKYLQPKDSPVLAYFPPLAPWAKILDNPDAPLLITEGEKKAAAACKAGFPCIGLGGVWSFGGKEPRGLLPELDVIEWSGRTVTVVYDADAAGNPQVAKAENALAYQLAQRGAAVRVARLPALEGLPHTGLDDLLPVLLRAGFQEILDAAEHRSGGAKELADYIERFVLVETIASAYDSETHTFFSRTRFMDAFPSGTVAGFGPTGRPVKLKKSQAWWDSPAKQTATRLVLEPNAPLITEGGNLNTFAGWGVPAKAGPLLIWHELLKMVFSGNREHIRWFERWLAYPLQHPGAKLHQSVFVYGGQGVGKSAIGQIMLDIYGKSGRLVQDAQLFGSFNGWMASCLFAMGDDLCFDERRKSRSVLKSLVDGEAFEVNEKYVPSYSAPNRCNLYLTANSPGALPLDASGLNRRFLIIEAPYTRPKPREWYTGELHQWRKKGGAGAVHHRLLKLPLEDFHPNADAPETEHQVRVVETSRSNCEAWVCNLESHTPYDLSSAKELYALYQGKTNDQRTGLGAFTAALHPYVTFLGQQRVNGADRLSLIAVRNGEAWAKRSTKVRASYYEKERGRIEKDSSP